MFMQNGPFRLQSTCTHCGGTGKTVSVQYTIHLHLFTIVPVDLKRMNLKFCYYSLDL